MKYSARLDKLERNNAHRLCRDEQERRLLTFIEVETMVRGERPTEAMIEAERARLAQPIKQSKREEIRAIAEEIEKIINDRP